MYMWNTKFPIQYLGLDLYLKHIVQFNIFTYIYYQYQLYLLTISLKPDFYTSTCVHYIYFNFHLLISKKKYKTTRKNLKHSIFIIYLLFKFKKPIT